MKILAQLQDIVSGCKKRALETFTACRSARSDAGSSVGVDKVLAWAEAEEATALALIDVVKTLERQIEALTAERDDLQSQLEGIGEGQAS